MIARDPSRGLDDGVFRDHISWNRRAGPLISFSSNWNKAMRRRGKFIDQGAQNVIVIAVWLEGLEVYDAYGIACHLHTDRPAQHLDEFLLHGAIDSDSYRILSTLHGTLELKDMAVSVAGWTSEAKIPGGFAHSTQNSTLRTRVLKDATKISEMKSILSPELEVVLS